MSFIILLGACACAFLLQVALGYEFASNYHCNRLHSTLKAAARIAMLAIAIGIGSLAGSDKLGREHALNIVFIAGLLGFLVSLFWYVKYPTPLRKVTNLMPASVPQTAATDRPWHSLPKEAKKALRAPGDLGDYGEPEELPPLRFPRRMSG